MILRKRRQRGHSAVRILPCLTTFLLLLNAFFLSESSNIHYTPHKLKDHAKRRRIQSLNGGKNSKGGRGTLKTQNEERRMKKSTKDFKSRHDFDKLMKVAKLKSMMRYRGKMSSPPGGAAMKNSRPPSPAPTSSSEKNNTAVTVLDEETLAPQGGRAITIIDATEAIGIFDCKRAYELQLEEIAFTEPKSNISHIKNCRGGFTDSEYDLNVKGSWFTIKGTGGLLMATSCPAFIAVYEGENCEALHCSRSFLNKYGCQVEWNTSYNKIYWILVMDKEQSQDRMWVIVEDIGAAPPSEGIDNQFLLNEYVNGAQQLEIYQCENNSIEVTIGARVSGDFQFPLDVSFETCESEAWPRNAMNAAVDGAWFTVVGHGRTLRATSCPFELSVYKGSCNNLTCENGTYSDDVFGCEFEWISPLDGSANHILIQSTVAGFQETGPFELSVVNVLLSPTTMKPGPTAPPLPTMLPTVTPTSAIPTTNPTRRPSTPSPTSLPITPMPSSTPIARTPAPTMRTIIPVTPMPSTTTMLPTTSTPTFSSSENIQIPTISSSTSMPSNSTSMLGSMRPTLISTEMPTVKGGNVTLQQCQNNSIPIQAGEQIESAFLFPLSESYLPCEGSISRNESKTIRASWVVVDGNGSSLQVNACPYQLSVYNGQCTNLTCAVGQYRGNRGCDFTWITPGAGLSYILVRSTIESFPEVGNLTFSLSVRETITRPTTMPSNASQSPAVTPTIPPTLEPTSEQPSNAPTRNSSGESLTVSPTPPSTTGAPTFSPITPLPTSMPTTQLPTVAPTTEMPSSTPTVSPTSPPTTLSPTFSPTSEAPSTSPTALQTLAPTLEPTTLSPTFSPTSEAPSTLPTALQTLAPTLEPTRASANPSAIATVLPTLSATTLSPTFRTNTSAPPQPTVLPAPTISPAPTFPPVRNDICEGAFRLYVGETLTNISTDGATPDNLLDKCGNSNLETQNVTKRGIWYSISAQSATSSIRRLRANACNGTDDEAPVQLTLYESDNGGCGVLTCAVTVFNLGCVLEWDIPPPTLRAFFMYKLLVEQAIPRNDTLGGGTFSLSLEAADVPVNDNCFGARTIDVGQTVTSSALLASPESNQTISLCERDKRGIYQHIANGEPVLGVWYRIFVGGRVRLLASACNSRRSDLVYVTVYSGSCTDLTCLSSPSTPSAPCETVWDAASSETVYFILVERVLETGVDPADFRLSIQLIGR